MPAEVIKSIKFGGPTGAIEAPFGILVQLIRRRSPGEFEPPKPITKAERDARKAFRQVDAEKAMTEHEIAQKAFSANRERLKAERLTREAAGPPVAAKKAKTKRKAR